MKSGRLKESEIDEPLKRLLALKFRMGLFENPRRPDLAKAAAEVARPDHRAAVLDAARQSLVLLQNNGLLPLDPAKVKSIAVVGPNADDDLQQLGDWSLGSSQHPPEAGKHPREKTVTVLDGIKAVAPKGTTVRYEKGCAINNADLSGLPAAVAAAQASDVVVAVVGDHLDFIGEEKSTATLELQGGQVALLDALAKTGKPMIVVLVNSKPLVLPGSVKGAPAILEAFNPGMEGGRAIAEAVFGQLNPSGKLTISFPVHVGQQPTFYNQVRGQHGTRYADLTQEPLFPFGHGLSYTQYRYSNPRLASATLAKGQAASVSVDVENVGKRAGDEIVAGLRERRRDLGHVGDQGAEGVRPRAPRARREEDGDRVAAVGSVPARGRRRQPRGRAGRLRHPRRAVVSRQGPAEGDAARRSEARGCCARVASPEARRVTGARSRARQSTPARADASDCPRHAKCAMFRRPASPGALFDLPFMSMTADVPSVVRLLSVASRRRHLCGARAPAARAGARRGRARPPRIYNTQRLAGQPPSIDGRLDDEAWKEGEWAGDYIQQLPVEGGVASQKTELKVLYDDKHVYFAIRAYDDMSKVTKYPARRDAITGDVVGVCFDSLYDKRSGFEFDLNAAGTKIDLVLTNEGWDTTWDAVWDGKVAYEADAWTAEFRIPLSQLRYSPQDVQVWGMHSWRWIDRLQEESQWNLIPRQGTGRLYNFGELHGIHGLEAAPPPRAAAVRARPGRVAARRGREPVRRRARTARPRSASTRRSAWPRTSRSTRPSTRTSARSRPTRPSST